MSVERILKEAKLKQELVSLHLDPHDWSRCSVGFVDLVTADHVRLRSVSKSGEPSGYEIRPLAEISKIETGGKYENCLKLLMENREQIFKEIKLGNESTGDLIRDTLQKALEESVVIVIWGSDPGGSLVGYVEKLDADTVSVKLINEFGESDGISTIAIDQIIFLDFNTQSDQIRSFLYNRKNAVI
jgi:hypothetical protein